MFFKNFCGTKVKNHRTSRLTSIMQQEQIVTVCNLNLIIIKSNALFWPFDSKAQLKYFRLILLLFCLYN